MVDGQGHTDLVERDTVEQILNVIDGVDGHAQPANLSLGQFVVRIVAGQRRVVEVGAYAGLPVLQQKTVPLVGLRSRKC